MWVRVALASIAFLFSMASTRWIFHRMPVTSDEYSYVFQAHNFRDGCIKRPAPPVPEAFASDMIVIDSRAGWFSRYPPGHPLWLLPGVLFDAIHAVIGLAAACAIWFICGAASALGISQIGPALLLLASPFFFFMYGTHLSHTSGLVASAALCWAYVKGQSGPARWPMAIAGFAWSFLFLNRTYTALLIALPFGVDALYSGFRRRNRDQFRRIALFAGAASIGVLAYLAYNRAATGSALQATYLFYEPSEGLGFGPRRTQGIAVYHTLSRGISFLIDHVRTLNHWLFGFSGSLIVAALCALIGWSKRWSLLFATATWAVWLGYIGFWFKGIPDVGGPVYYFETLAFIVLLAALGLDRLWRAAARWPRGRIAVSLLLTLAMLGHAAYFSIIEADRRAAKQKYRRAIADRLRTLPPRSLVFVEKFTFPNASELVFNPRGLASDPLCVRSQYEDNPTMQRLFRERKAFLLHGAAPLNPVPLPPPERLTLQREARKFHRRTGHDESRPNSPCVRVAEADRDAANWLAFGHHLNLPAGSYRIQWMGACHDVTEEAPSRAELTTRRGRDLWASATITGSREPIVAEMKLTLTNDMTAIEPRIYFGGSGKLLLREVRVEEMGPVAEAPL